MANGDFKDWPRSTASDKILPDKAFNIARKLKGDEYQRGLASVVDKFFDKKYSGGAVTSEIISNQELAEEIHKPIIRKFETRKVDSSFTDNICGADLVDMQLINKFDEEIHFKICVIDIFNKHALIFPLKDKKFVTITNAFQKILNKSGDASQTQYG